MAKKSGTNTQQTVFIIDNDSEIINVIRDLLESVQIKVLTYSSAENFLQEYKQNLNCSGCLILDVRMQKMSGLQLQRVLKNQGDTVPIIFITGHGDIQMTKRAIKAGAVDFIPKPFNNHELLETVQQVLQQNVITLHKQQQQNEMTERYKSLTTREKEIMHAVVAGDSNNRIAQNLEVSVSTVETHRARMMLKMKAKSIAELVKFAICYNLIAI